MSGAVRILAAPGLVKLRSASELVGRRDELGALEGELSRATAGEFRLVLLLGDAGVGKSRLGRELLARHPEVTGLAAKAYPAASAAFGLWTEALDPFLQSLPASEVIELRRTTGSRCAPMAPASSLASRRASGLGRR